MRIEELESSWGNKIPTFMYLLADDQDSLFPTWLCAICGYVGWLSGAMAVKLILWRKVVQTSV